jgi:hypothetical protein
MNYFCSFFSVAKRLECLGALTHGDRRATETRDLSRFNIDNKYGKQALENVIRSICNLERPWAPFPKMLFHEFLVVNKLFIYQKKVQMIDLFKK